jgi:hypothetical protein
MLKFQISFKHNPSRWGRWEVVWRRAGGGGSPVEEPERCHQQSGGPVEELSGTTDSWVAQGQERPVALGRGGGSVSSGVH